MLICSWKFMIRLLKIKSMGDHYAENQLKMAWYLPGTKSLNYQTYSTKIVGIFKKIGELF